jgi:ubiquinone biosynthesis protein
MMLEDGIFHADPHPGNVFYLPDNRIAFIDFGMAGRLSEKRRYQAAVLLQRLVTQDSALVADVLCDWGDDAVDREQLTVRIENFLAQYHGVPLKQLDLGVMLSHLVAILRDHGLALPPDLALLIKAFIGLEGMGRQLDPDFDMARETTPFLQRVLLAHYSPEALVERGRRTGGHRVASVDRTAAGLEPTAACRAPRQASGTG